MSQVRWSSTLSCVLGFLVLASGCGGPSDDPQPTAGTDDLWLMILSDATEAGASDAQLAALRKASETGSLSQEDLMSLIEDTFACFDLHGIPYGVDEPDIVAPGLSFPQYHFGDIPGLSPEESLRIADDCIEVNSLFAEVAFHQQPSAQALLDAADLEELPEAILCLRNEGVDIEDDATLDEVRTETRRLIMRQLEADIKPPFWVYCLSSYELQ